MSIMSQPFNLSFNLSTIPLSSIHYSIRCQRFYTVLPSRMWRFISRSDVEKVRLRTLENENARMRDRAVVNQFFYSILHQADLVTLTVQPLNLNHSPLLNSRPATGAWLEF